ncbi:MAG: phospho-N-acetylmuramoyl-pentapeptide-transferase [Chloroflexi bacterium]|nr:phospho-N-acetylmuramoyl-pentapeptide-transferase [Chloroflexota bacterium]MBI3732269.1 phospho-N-acetylmuramoyl-pentapeptide-transferase [Chloroflexota bacterium]
MAYSLTLAAISFFLAVGWGPTLIRLLKRYRIGQTIRIEGPVEHQSKMGTPTMGGLMIIGPVVAITLVANLVQILSSTAFGQSVLATFGIARQAFAGRSLIVPLFAMAAYGIFGAVDDYLSVRGGPGRRGLLAREQLPVQIGIAGIIAGVLYFGPPHLDSVALPGVREKIDIGLLWLPLAIVIIVGFANAVNMTDGLDGLAGTCSAVAFAAYGIIAFLQGQGWLATFCFTVVGAVLAFLWFNAYPADMFMGGTGSVALGGTLGTVALMTGQWLLLPLVGIIFVAEAGAVILQVAYFKRTGGKRLFKMSPLHNHFVLTGWSEMHITQRFWLIGIIGAMFGVALALL